MLHKLDTALLVALSAAVAFPSGPASVIALAVACVHFMHGSGRPRVQMSPAYAMLVPIAAIAAGMLPPGFSRAVAADASLQSGNSPGAIVASSAVLFIAALLLVLAVALDAILPLAPPWPSRRGREVACAVMHVSSGDDVGPPVDYLLRVYYPCAPTRGAEPLPYLLHGRATAAGFASFMRIPRAIFDWLVYLPSRAWEADPDTAPVDPKAVAAAPGGRLRLAVFSHGLGGTPDCYTAWIEALVDDGFVVMAPEHADGSAAYTIIPGAPGFAYQPLTREERGDVRLEYRRRHRQLKQRVEELRSAIDVAARLLVERPTPKKGGAASDARAADVGAAPPGDDALLLQLLLRDHVQDPAADGVVALGHSFGAASALALADRDRRVAGVVAYDAWAFPLSPATIERGLGHVSVVSLVGDGFARWRENDDALQLLLLPHRRAAHVARSASTPPKPAAADRVTAHGDAPIADGGAATPATTLIHGNGVGKRGETDPRLALRVPHEAAAPANKPKSAKPIARHYRVTGTMHQNFCDFAFTATAALRAIGLAGAADPREAMRAMQDAARLVLSGQADGVYVDAAAPASGSGGSARSTCRRPEPVNLVLIS